VFLTGPKKILILGYGVAGSSTASFLQKKGHEIVIYDDNIKDTYNFARSNDLKRIDAIIKSPGVPFMPHNMHPIIKMAKEYKIPMFSNYDIFSLYHPEAKVIAITGTNGKSTTTALIYHILLKSGVKVCMGGNIGIPYGDLEHADVYIFELSSYELAFSKHLNFDTCCVLNIKPDHLENHGNFKNYITAKHNGLDYAKYKIISMEDEITYEKYNETADIIVSTKNKNNGIHIAEKILIDNNKVICDLSFFSELRGNHNYQNIAFAYAVCKHLEMFPKEIARHIATFKALPHRMCVIRQINKILFVNDSKATNPDSAAKALESYIGYGIFWLVGGRSKQVEIMKAIEPYLDSVCKIYLFGEAEKEFEQIFSQTNKTVSCKTLGNALQKAYLEALTEVGPSVILLAPMCSSFDQFDNYRDRGEYFCNLVKKLRPVSATNAL
jgi:UDP-N-acetylmuramoylalanine--D-glutamate ligase